MRDSFWYEAKLYAKVAAVVFLPFVILIWLMIEFLETW